MADRTRYSKQTADDGTFSESIERTLGEKELAQTHVIGRNRRVATFLCYMSLMQGRMPALAKARVKCKRASYQDFNSVDDNEAAHYLPGQIFLTLPGKTAQDPTEFVTDRKTKDAIGSLFSRVQDLPSAFNKADSYVEKYTRPGLKDLFARATRKVLANSAQTGTRVGAVVAEAVSEWIDASIQAYSDAINRKTDIADLRDNPIPPGTVPEMREDGALEPHMYKPDRADFYERAVRKNRHGQTTATIWDYDTQIRILGHYVKFSSGFVLPPAIVHDVESTFKP